MHAIQRALVSVFDKRGVVEFARALADMGVEVLSTGGTARLLADAGVAVREVADLTGFPEILDGRVKTLHPRIHAGILAIRDNPAHRAQLAAHGIGPIDLVAVNLYPFGATIRTPGVRFEDVIENIDIGGPAMIRAAAKNFPDVAVLTDPDDYPAIVEEIRQAGGLGRERLFSLARKAFAHTARYDGEIAQYLSGVETAGGSFRLPEDGVLPGRLFLDLERVSALRYGENPHQQAGFYRWGGRAAGLAAARQLQGKELSYNNLMDLQAAWGLVREFDQPAAAIVKHTNPCGAAVGRDLEEAYTKAHQADPVAAFGSIIALNRPLDAPTAAAMAPLFVEAVIAPRIEEAARAILAAKKSLRLVELEPTEESDGTARLEVRRVDGGLLVQTADRSDDFAAGAPPVVTSRAPTGEEWRDLAFAWKVARHVKSNAIVLARDGKTVGVGAGQMSRIDAVRLSLEKAGPAADGSVLASDAFFPFRDGVDAAARAGVRAVIQPGGSRNDPEVIAAAEEQGLAMVFTGARHFRH